VNELIPSSPAPGGEFLFYQTEDGKTRLEVRVQQEKVWLSLNQMADLFQRDKSVISRHIANVFAEGELKRDSVVANHATTAADGKTYQVEFFSLDVIIFATVQNKMHWAAHGQTAAEVVHARADAAKPQMGMTNWVGAKPSKAEAVIAKNHLSSEELEALNRIVTVYLEAAELAALNRKPMYMRDWIAKLDDFLRLSGRDILRHAGKISHEQAAQKAELEFEKFHRAQLAAPSQVEKDFEAAVKGLKKLPAPARKKRNHEQPDHPCPKVLELLQHSP
jgi:hypothetical protein